MQRILEPELMTDVLQCQAYAAADFTASNEAFVEFIRDHIPTGDTTALDLGCGPADVMIRLAVVCPQMAITAVDGSEAMIQLASKAILECGLEERITPVVSYVPGLPFPSQSFDAVFSKDFLHHLPDPSVMWEEIRSMVRPGGLICIMDLRRPDSPEAARALVDSVTGSAPEILQTDFYNSLCAAFTPDEIKKQLQLASLDLEVSECGNRHLLIYGHIGKE